MGGRSEGGGGWESKIWNTNRSCNLEKRHGFAIYSCGQVDHRNFPRVWYYFKFNKTASYYKKKRVSSSNIFSKDIFIFTFETVYTILRSFTILYLRKIKFTIDFYEFWSSLWYDYPWLVIVAETFTNYSEHYFDQMTYV